MKKILYILPALLFAWNVQSASALIDLTVEINDSTINGPILEAGALYGKSIANIGDLNGDGVNDIAVGSPNSGGVVYIHFMNTDGSIDSTVEINSSTPNGPPLTSQHYYGKSIANIGDLNGDGVNDIAVGALIQDGTAQNAVYIHFMNTDGSIVSTVEINSSTPNGPGSEAYNSYASSIANIGDLNGDGVNDIAVGAVFHDLYLGAILIHFMNTDGSIDSTVVIDSSTVNGPPLYYRNFYGESITNIGDLNGDGVNDIAVGAYNSYPYTGAVFIHFMNTDGSIDSTVEINDSTTNGPSLGEFDHYGKSIANIGDHNGDGINDIAVGAYGDHGNGESRGAVHIHFMNTDGSIDSTVEINDSTTNGPILDDSSHYGTSIANVGDLNGDGVTDIAVGAHSITSGTDDLGTVYIHFIASDIISPTLREVTPVPSPTVDTTPNYTFNTDEAGAITYGGSCSSTITNAAVGNNIITFNTLSLGTYSNCTITVTDAVGNTSNLLSVSTFTIESVPTTKPLYRFWSDVHQGHFYTASESERDSIIANYPENVWKYEGIAYGAIDKNAPNAKPVHRFWSDTYMHHFYTISESEKDSVVAKYPDQIWRYEGIAYYAYNASVTDSRPVYRFWSDEKMGHFYTASESEKDKVIANYPEHVWKYEGIAWHVPK